MSETLPSNRLSKNFHQTFKPERHYIASLLRFAAAGSSGDLQEIASATGIPTGSSSGKVPAILDYCRGMGLIKLARTERPTVRKPELTPFGRTVLLDDPYLKTGISQWIAHLNLCSPLTGADVWYRVFFMGTDVLGMTFGRTALNSYLSLELGASKKGLCGPLIGMYQDEASFKLCGALAESSKIITRSHAPVDEEYGSAYGAWILQLMEDHYPNQGQVSTAELDSRAGLRTIPGWKIGDLHRVLARVEFKGLIEVDRHMEPWLIRRRTTAEAAWKQIFDDLL